jgi:hypothetical protein
MADPILTCGSPPRRSLATAFAPFGEVIAHEGDAARLPFTQIDRRFCFDVPFNIVTGVTFASSLTSQSISAAVPPAAKTASGLIGASLTTGTGSYYIASDANGLDARAAAFTGSGSSTTTFGFTMAAAFHDLMMATAQTVFIMVSGGGITNAGRLSITGFTF